MISEYESEPIRGLPGNLPPGERILWQGAPEWRSFAANALHLRGIGFYFAALLALAMVGGSMFGMLATVIAAAVLLGLFALFAVLVARTTVYTLTNRRVVLGIGIALNSCINLPLKLIAAADLRALPDGHGDIALTLKGRHRIGYAMLWPHARPWRFAKPQPMLRALPNAVEVARTLASACAVEAEISPAVRSNAESAAPGPVPAMREAAA